jgi:hypothetical protein
MARDGIGADEAFARLMATSRESGLEVSQLAERLAGEAASVAAPQQLDAGGGGSLTRTREL